MNPVGGIKVYSCAIPVLFMVFIFRISVSRNMCRKQKKNILLTKKVASKTLIFCALLCMNMLCFLDFVAAQNKIVSVNSSSASSKSFSLKDGLAVNCLESSYMDSKGRIWLNPCKSTAMGLGFSFFQFDGSKSMFYELGQRDAIKESETYVWKIWGELPNGTFYGASYDSKSIKQMLFLWNIETNHIEFQTLEIAEKLLAVNSNERGEVFTLTVKGNYYRIYSRSAGEWKMVVSIDMGLMDDRLFSPPYDFIFKNGDAWFLHQTEGLIRADLERGKIELLSWSKLGKGKSLSTNKYDLCCAAQSWKLTEAPNGDFLLFLGSQNGYYTLDPESLELKPHDNLNSNSDFPYDEDDFLMVYFTRDRNNNLLIVSGSMVLDANPCYDYENFRASIWNNDGSWEDISSSLESERPNLAMNGLDHPGKFFGYNFHQEIGWISEDGITLVDVRSDLDVETFKIDSNKKFGIRSMNQRSSETMFFSNDLESLMELDVNTGSIASIHQTGMPPVWPLSKMIIRKQKMYVSARGGKLLTINLANNSFEEDSLGFDFHKFAFIDENRIIISSIKGNLYEYNLASKVLTPVISGNSNIEINSEVSDLKLLDDDILLVSALNGLWQFDLRTNELKHLKD